jgi:hypothetical protein
MSLKLTEKKIGSLFLHQFIECLMTGKLVLSGILALCKNIMIYIPG